MEKLGILSATILLVLVVDASVYRTTTIIVAGKTNPKEQEQDCRQQFEQQEKLFYCQDFIREKSEEKYRRNQWQRAMQYPLGGCCMQLLNIRSRCRCDALEMAARERGGGEVQLTRKAMRVAREIPFMCDIIPGRCQFGPSKLKEIVLDC